MQGRVVIFDMQIVDDVLNGEPAFFFLFSIYLSNFLSFNTLNISQQPFRIESSHFVHRFTIALSWYCKSALSGICAYMPRGIYRSSVHPSVCLSVSELTFPFKFCVKDFKIL